MEPQIVKICRVPSWKFWKTAQWEVTVKLNGETKTFSIFKSLPLGRVGVDLFLDYIKNKAVYSTQWDREIKNIQNKQKNIDSMAEMEKELQKLVGKKISI